MFLYNLDDSLCKFNKLINIMLDLMINVDDKTIMTQKIQETHT